MADLAGEITKLKKGTVFETVAIWKKTQMEAALLEVLIDKDNTQLRDLIASLKAKQAAETTPDGGKTDREIADAKAKEQAEIDTLGAEIGHLFGQANIAIGQAWTKERATAASLL